VETDYTDDSFCEKTIKKTILRVLGSNEFSHSLDPSLTCHADFVSDIRSDESRNQPYCASQTQTMMDMDLRI
jgi:hypothetical protein